ncbi:flagellar filament capping protein FliD [Salinibacter ruber]|uniref:flagellar filament capping protein FliD n=1 Tax=Salinibacter ruber TaxID=146919 RepID=UPI00216A9050|nr:flagellar filament capping protein FliD [Salinibacter ruber]MCS4048555.1 flagellar hook-associated protein 2 [Salinibacter ruber]
MGTSVGPSSGLTPKYQRLIQRTLRIERQPKLELQNERQQKKDTKSVVSDLDGKLSSLQSQLSTLTDTVSSPFEGRSANTAEGTKGFSVSADETANTGSYSLSVNRLASEDGRVSQKFDASKSTLSDFFTNNGAQTFSVEVSTPTDSNPDARTSVDVTVDSDGTNNKEVLSDIQSAVDSAFQSAVDNGALSADQRPSASVINPTSSTARLSLRSQQTGYQGRLSFSDSSNNLLSELQVNADQIANDTQGGEITEVGTGEGSSKLTSEFELNGLTFTRNSNEVTDAVDGVTINLEEATGTTSSFEVSADEEGAKDAVKEFIKRYNEVNNFLQNKTEVNPDSEERSAFANDGTFQRLGLQLRNDATRPVESLPDRLNTLADIGIEASRDGTLELSDEDAFSSALRNDQEALKDLFSGSDGVATRLENRVDSYVEAGGVIDDREDIIDSSIDRIDDRINGLDERLQRRQQQLRDRFAEVQSTIRSLASQQQSISQRLL